jgi:MFS family permease
MSDTKLFTVTDIFQDRATAFKFVSVLGLQMGQVFPAAFFGMMLTGIYRENGLPLDMLWVFTIPAIPTWLRPLWAPYVDSVGSRKFGVRKTWILPCTTFGALAYLTLGFFEPTVENLVIIIGLLFLKGIIMSTQDIAIDGYMVENLSDQERAAGAATIDIGRNIARFVSLAGIVWIYGVYGWAIAASTAAGLLVLFSLPALIRTEPPPPAEVEAARARGERPTFFGMIRRPDIKVLVPLFMLLAFSASLIPSLIVPFLVDLGLSTAHIGPKILAPVGLLGTVIGASVAVWILGKTGYKRSMFIGAIVIFPAVAPIMWLASLGEPSLLIVQIVIFNGIVLPSLIEVAVGASRLKWASKKQAATDYATFVVAGSIASNAALAVGGFLAAWLGYFWYFAVTGVFVSACCLLFYSLFDIIESLVNERDRSIANESNKNLGFASSAGK